MAYRPLEIPRRGDVLGSAYLRQLHDNLTFARRVFEAEHNVDGSHTAYAVPDFVCTLIDSTIHGDSEGIASYIGGGVHGISLPFADFPPESISVTAQAWTTTATARPMTTRYSAARSGLFPDRTNIQIYTKEMTSTLGAGNSWSDSATTVPVSIAVHVEKPRTQFQRRQMRLAAGETVRDFNLEDWNGLIYGVGELHEAVRTQHSASGSHSSKRIPEQAHALRSESSDYSRKHAWGAVSVVTDPSTGYAAIAYAASPSTSAMFCTSAWSEGDYEGGSSASNIKIAVPRHTASTYGVSRFSFDGTNWALEHGSIFVAIHNLL
jgi:hypothetical protein